MAEDIIPEGTPIVKEGEFDNYEGPEIVEPGQEEIEPEVEESEATPEIPQPEPEVVGPDDPGEFQPNDYSFEVTTFTGDENKPRVHKINSVEQWDDLLDSDPNFGSPASLLKAQRLATKMESGVDRDEREYQSKKQEYDQFNESQQAREQATNNMVNELTYLSDKGELPAVSNELQSANWGDPEVAKQPGVREQLDLLNYMRDENQRRIQAGLKPMTSVLDAFNAKQLDDSRKASQEAQRTSATRRKQAASRVAGATPRPVSTVPKGISVGRGGSLDDLEMF